MVTRITAIPDSNGIIRVSCGSDTIEITVPTGGSGGGSSGGATNDPFGGATAALRVPTLPDPFREPNTFIVEPGGDGDAVPFVPGAIADSVLQRKTTPHLPDFASVLLSIPDAIDLHALADLGRRLSQGTPEVRLKVLFGKRDE